MKVKQSSSIFFGISIFLVFTALIAWGQTAALENPYGLDALWKGGDFVSRGTLLILALMSSISWYIMITKSYEQYKIFKQSNETEEKFWTAKTFDQGVEKLPSNSIYRYIALTGKGSLSHHNASLQEKMDVNSWLSIAISRVVERFQNRMQDGLSFLATVGSTAPFIGLFGTVWGIYHALTAIGIAGQASIDKVAGPVGEALIMTAIGLAVATPAAIGYNLILRRNKKIMEDLRLFGSDLHTTLLRGAMPGPDRKRDY